ncbi:MAG: DnaJ domain-containing protein [Clostridia bacterium]|nr:DnaJ domain-containing protein [Clostridia bacterium]
MTKYFDHCTSVEELKKAYHKAAMQYHPDHGGSDETMKEVNRQYEQAAERLAGDSKPGQKVNTDYSVFDADAFRRAVEVAAHYPDIVLELVGRWLWATGNTYPCRDELKAAGYRWSHSHKAWYYRDDSDICTKGGKKTLDEIKAKYGSERIVSANWASVTLPA